jgi:hypothetical protein
LDLANFPDQFDKLAKNAGFVNDVHLAFSTISIGALLYIENKTHFQIVRGRILSLKVE